MKCLRRYIYWYYFQVAIIFTCAGLVRNTVFTYLPLFLTERLQFAKVNIVSVSTILFSYISFGKCIRLKQNAVRVSTTSNNHPFSYINLWIIFPLTLLSLFPLPSMLTIEIHITTGKWVHFVISKHIGHWHALKRYDFWENFIWRSWHRDLL